MIYGYASASAREQGENGDCIDIQEKTLRENGATDVFTDVFAENAKNKPNLNKLLAKLEPGDTLAITKLNRAVSCIVQGNDFVNGLITKGVRVNILNIGTIDNTPDSEIIRSIFASFAECEGNMLAERMQEGKAIAKLNPNFHEGRPKLYEDRIITYALKLLEAHTYGQVAELTGISKSTLTRARREQKT